jgi:ribosomal-protein-alanine N-acetyltransferase
VKLPDLFSIEDEIHGEKIYLRRVLEKDVDGSYPLWMNDSEVSQFLESRFLKLTRDDLRMFVREMMHSKDSLFLAIIHKENSRHIGNIKLGPIDKNHSRADIGLLIGEKDFWGKGLAADAISAVTEFAFAKIGIHKLCAGCYEPNKGSEKAFLRVGFVLEAKRRQHFKFDNTYVDELLFCKFNPESRA